MSVLLSVYSVTKKNNAPALLISRSAQVQKVLNAFYEVDKLLEFASKVPISTLTCILAEKVEVAYDTVTCLDQYIKEVLNHAGRGYIYNDELLFLPIAADNIDAWVAVYDLQALILQFPSRATKITPDITPDESSVIDMTVPKDAGHLCAKLADNYHHLTTAQIVAIEVILNTVILLHQT